VAGAYWYAFSPARYLIAVGPPESPEARLLQSFSTLLDRLGGSVRVRVALVPHPGDAAQALDERRVDLAVVRPDVRLPGNGLTVAILREEAVLILTPSGDKVSSPSDLAGKSIALVSRTDADLPVLRALLDQYDAGSTARIEITPLAELQSVVRANRLQAVVVVASLSDPEARQAAALAAAGFGKAVTLLAVDQAAAMAARNPSFSPIDIPAGALMGKPAVPDEEIKGLAVASRLMARAGLDRGPVSTLTERLFEHRTELAKTAPLAAAMKAPETDAGTSAPIPNHRGALDYFNREQLTFMDRYGDWLWFALFAAGGVSSAFAWVGRLFVRRRRAATDDALDRLAQILAKARKADTRDELSRLAAEADQLVAACVRLARRRTTTTRTMGALMLAIESVRGALNDRRAELAAGASEPGFTPRLKAARRTGSPEAR